MLFHHDPQRTDRAVAEIEAKARAIFGASSAAREGMEIVLGAQADRPGVEQPKAPAASAA